MEVAINIDQIQKTYVNKSQQYSYISYCEGEKEKRIFFGLIKNKEEVKPHWISHYGQKFDTREDFIKQEKNCFINDEVLTEFSIWRKPCLIIVMTGSGSVDKHFESEEEMYNFLNKLIEKSNRKLVII